MQFQNQERKKQMTTNLSLDLLPDYQNLELIRSVFQMNNDFQGLFGYTNVSMANVLRIL